MKCLHCGSEMSVEDRYEYGDPGYDCYDCDECRWWLERFDDGSLHHGQHDFISDAVLDGWLLVGDKEAGCSLFGKTA